MNCEKATPLTLKKMVRQYTPAIAQCFVLVVVVAVGCRRGLRCCRVGYSPRVGLTSSSKIYTHGHSTDATDCKHTPPILSTYLRESPTVSAEGRGATLEHRNPPPAMEIYGRTQPAGLGSVANRTFTAIVDIPMVRRRIWQWLSA